MANLLDELHGQCGICHLPLNEEEAVFVWVPEQGQMPCHKICADFFHGSRPPLEERQRRFMELRDEHEN